MAYLNVTQDLTKEGRKQLKVGQVLIFDYEGSPVYLKIMSKVGDEVFAKRLDPELFLTPEEADEQIVIKKK
jgi:hypothetical protein